MQVRQNWPLMHALDGGWVNAYLDGVPSWRCHLPRSFQVAAPASVHTFIRCHTRATVL